MSLIEFVTMDNYDMCRSLLEKGADPNMSNDWGQTMIYIATLNGCKDILKLLLDFGGDPNILCRERARYREIHSPLHISTHYGFYNRNDIDDLLLSYDANPNSKNNYGDTPLHISSCVGYDPLIRLLLKYSANINIKNKYGRTPLHNACMQNKISSVRLLLDAGADLFIPDNKGLIPKDLTKNNDIINLIEEYEIPIKEPE